MYTFDFFSFSVLLTNISLVGFLGTYGQFHTCFHTKHIQECYKNNKFGVLRCNATFFTQMFCFVVFQAELVHGTYYKG